MLPRSEISVPEERPVACSPPKKGMRDHAERLIQLSGDTGILASRPITVIGDGRSDHFLFRSLESMRKRFPDMPQPFGLFLRNPALELFETNSDHCKYFATWKELCEAISSGKTTRSGGVAIVDVDRTLILARGIMDHIHSDVRTRSLESLSKLFAISEEALSEANNIGDIASELEGSLCYYRDQGDPLCHENFEVIALTATLKTIGLYSDDSICRILPPDEELLDTLKLCRSEAKRGNWIAQFDHHEVGSHRHWNEELAISFLTDAIDAIERGDPSICPMFRRMEFLELLEAKRINMQSFFNQELVDALLEISALDIIFVSDRPITSVYDGKSFLLEEIHPFP